jgi:hypothetical protein
MQIEKISSPGQLSPDFSHFIFMIIFIHLLIIGTVGNLVIIFGYSYKSSWKKNTAFLAFILISTIHIILLYMSSLDFINMDRIIDLLLKSGLACSVYNIVYRSMSLLEIW